MTMNGDEPFAPGDMFLKYRIDSLLGRGGHAYVYASEDTYLDRPVALKIIPSPLETRSEVFSRGKQEAKILSQIEHPSIVKVYDAGVTQEGVTYIAMERLTGRTLRDALQFLGPFSILEMLHVGIQIAEAVQVAHAHHAIHRDLKPENVFVLPGNAIKVLDFGISKLLDGGSIKTTQPNMARGTPQYMSPEQIEGCSLTIQSDVFALGNVLYELLIAMAPVLIGLDEVSNVAIIHSQIHKVPPHLCDLSPSIPRYVDRVIRCMLAKVPTERQVSMAQVADDLRALQQRFTAESPSPRKPLRELWQERNEDWIRAMESAPRGVNSVTTAVANVVLTNQVTAVVPSLKSNIPGATTRMAPMPPTATASPAFEASTSNFVPATHTRSRESSSLPNSKELVERARLLIAENMAAQRSRPAAEPAAPEPAQPPRRRNYSVNILLLATLIGAGLGVIATNRLRQSDASLSPNLKNSSMNVKQVPPVSAEPVPAVSSAPAADTAVKPPPVKPLVEVPASASNNGVRPAIAQTTKKAIAPASGSAAPHASAPAPWFNLKSKDEDRLVFLPKDDAKPRSFPKPAASATAAKKSTKKKDQLIFGADDLN